MREGVVLEYILRENEELDRALRKFRRKVQRAGIFRDIKKHRFYEKPSEARRRKAKAAERRRRRRRRRAAGR
jgi:small subunit ribosomal protein S21